MDRLFSPWRMAYIRGDAPGSGAGRCIFCPGERERDDPESLVLGAWTHTVAICNLYPYNNGHVLVAPRRHVSSLTDLSRDELAELMSLAALGTRVLSEEYAPAGFNLGMNLGRVAGAGIEDHVHMHLVPRWNGDTNFMTSIHSTRVLPETLRETHARLLPKFRSLMP